VVTGWAKTSVSGLQIILVVCWTGKTLEAICGRRFMDADRPGLVQSLFM
jgi:hypothetical protein